MRSRRLHSVLAKTEIEELVDLLNKGTHFDEMLAALKALLSSGNVQCCGTELETTWCNRMGYLRW